MITRFKNLNIQSYLLKAIDISDLDSNYFQALNNLEHMRWSRQGSLNHDFDTAQNYINDLKIHGEFIGVYDQRLSKLIGTITLRIRGRSAQLGFLVFPQFANKGALSIILPHLREELHTKYDFNSLYIGTKIQNVGMRRVAEKSGFDEVSSANLDDSLRSFVSLDDEITHYLSKKA
jgi:RimJ/RimL family protein N-acetyltransferase